MNGVTTGSADAAVTPDIIAPTMSPHLKDMTEGVESVDQREFLSRPECGHVHACHHSEPLPVEGG